MKALQKAIERCEHCGRDMAVEQSGPYQFSARCACGSAWQFAWAWKNPAPLFQVVGQLELFT